jgi:hypothetical protein
MESNTARISDWSGRPGPASPQTRLGPASPEDSSRRCRPLYFAAFSHETDCMADAEPGLGPRNGVSGATTTPRPQLVEFGDMEQRLSYLFAQDIRTNVLPPQL